jgi:DNA-binding LytR/AlgR family response regulator
MDIERVVVELSETEHRVLDPADVYFLAGAGARTEIRLRGREPLVDVRELGEVVEAWARNGFVGIHRSYAVNLRRIQMLRLQADGRDWEVKLEPPVNAVLPIARDRLAGLRAALLGG